MYNVYKTGFDIQVGIILFYSTISPFLAMIFLAIAI